MLVADEESSDDQFEANYGEEEDEEDGSDEGEEADVTEDGNPPAEPGALFILFYPPPDSQTTLRLLWSD